MKFQTKSTQDLIVIHCKANLSGSSGMEAIQIIAEAAKNLVVGSTTAQAIVLDLDGTAEIDTEFLRQITLINKSLRPSDKKIFAIQVPSASDLFIKERGMNWVIHVVSSLNDVFSSLNIPVKGSGGTKIDVNFVNPFIEGALETLKIQCSCPARAGKPMLRNQLASSEFTTDIAGVIGLTSATFSGSIALCFPKQVFLGLIGNMLGEKYTEITPDLEDGAGELLNIIFGWAKRKLDERGYSMEKAIPTVIRGSGINVSHVTSSPTIVLPFETDLGPFQIQIGTTLARDLT